MRVDFGIENLFDRKYALPLGGAYAGQGRTMSLNPPASRRHVRLGNRRPGHGALVLHRREHQSSEPAASHPGGAPPATGVRRLRYPPGVVVEATAATAARMP